MEIVPDNLIPMFKLITEKAEKRINKELQESDVTFSQSRVLLLLCYHDGEDYSLKELEKIFHVTQQTMAGIIRRLEQKQLLRTYVDREDKRAKRAELTEAGRELSETIGDKMREIEAWIDSALEPAEVETLLKLLEKIYIHIDC